MTSYSVMREASIAAYEWGRTHYITVEQRRRPKPREIRALEALIANVRETCEHDYQNRERDGHRTGLGADCTKCGKELEHDFDPRTDRGHPTGMTCKRCGATEWQYVDGVLCHTDWDHRGPLRRGGQE